MVNNQGILCRFLYVDHAMFQPSKMKHLINGTKVIPKPAVTHTMVDTQCWTEIKFAKYIGLHTHVVRPRKNWATNRITLLSVLYFIRNNRSWIVPWFITYDS